MTPQVPKNRQRDLPCELLHLNLLGGRGCSVLPVLAHLFGLWIIKIDQTIVHSYQMTKDILFILLQKSTSAWTGHAVFTFGEDSVSAEPSVLTP